MHMNNLLRYTFFVLLGLSTIWILVSVPAREDRVTIQADAVGPFIADGETEQLRNFFGFHEPERTTTTNTQFFRWTTDRSNFVIRNGARLGKSLLLELRVCGCRGGSVAAPRFEVHINGEPGIRTYATPGWDTWRRYQMLIPSTTPSYTPDVLVELMSEVIPNTLKEGKPFGIALQQVTLRSVSVPQPVYSWFTAWGLGLLTTAGAYMFSCSLRQTIAIFAASLVLLVGEGWLYHIHPLPPSVLACSLLFGFGLALLLARTSWLRLVLTALFCLPVVLIQMLGAWLVDDAFISFRYAHNLVSGNGLVFNPGERVEGFTNFLWTMLFIPILASHIPPGLASLAMSLLLTQVTLALVWYGVCQLVAPRFAIVAVGLLLLSPSFLVWCGRGSGLEVALFCALLAGASVLYLTQLFKNRTNLFWIGVLFALAALTRPEGILVAMITLLFHALVAHRAGRLWWREAGTI